MIALLLAALALGLSNFAAAIGIGAVSVALSLVGLELGARIGAATGRRGELIGALVLIAVGIAITAGTL